MSHVLGPHGPAPCKALVAVQLHVTFNDVGPSRTGLIRRHWEVWGCAPDPLPHEGDHGGLSQ